MLVIVKTILIVVIISIYLYIYVNSIVGYLEIAVVILVTTFTIICVNSYKNVQEFSDIKKELVAFLITMRNKNSNNNNWASFQGTVVYKLIS